MQKNYKKAVEKAQKSVELKATIKGFFRLGQALKLSLNFEGAASAYKKAIALDVSDPN